MAVSSNNNNGQINFEADLSALSQFLETVQQLSAQSQSTSPQIRELNRAFRELNTTVTSLNRSMNAIRELGVVSSDLRDMIRIVNELRSSFREIEGGTRGINSLIQNISRLTEIMRSVVALSNEFNNALTNISEKPNVNSRSITSYYNQLNNAIINLQQSFEALNAASINLNSFNKSLTQMVDTYRTLSDLSNNFNTVLERAAQPHGIENAESYFGNVVALIERLNVLYNGLSQAVPSLDALGEGFEKLNQILQTLVETTTQFGQLFSNITDNDGSELVNYFNNVATSISKIDNVFNQVFENRESLTTITQQFQEMNNAITALANITERFNQVLVNTTEAPDFNRVLNYFTSLMQTVTSMNTEFMNLVVARDNFDNLLEIISQLSRAISRITRLSERLGTPEEIEQLQNAFQEVVRVLTQLVDEVNRLTINSQNFEQLNELLRNFSSTLNAINTTSRQANNQQRTLRQSVRDAGDSFRSTNNIVNSFINLFTGTGATSALSWVNGLTSGISALKGAFQTVLAVIGGKEVYDFLIGTNQQIEVLQKSLEVTLKSTEKAADTIRHLRSYAALTPFEELETFQAGEMLAANRMDIMRWMSVAGNLASAKKTAGVELNDVINVLTRINSGDYGRAMIRLRQMGISLNDLKAQGLEFSKNNTFLGTTDQMLDAVERIVNERYGGLTETLGQTVDGMISTIKDFTLQLGIELGKDMFADFKAALKEIKQYLIDFQDSEYFKKLIIDFNYFVSQIKSGLSVWINPLKTLILTIVNNLPAIGNFINVLLKFSALKTAVNIIQTILDAVNGLKSNYQVINDYITRENAAYKSQHAILGRIREEYAKIVALQQAGLRAQQDQAALQAAAQAGLQAANLSGNAAQAATSTGSTASGAATAATVAAVGSTVAQTAAKKGIGAMFSSVLTGASNALAAFSKIATVIALLAAVGGILKGIFGNREIDKSANTTEDWDRIISQNREEVDSLEKLNATREYTYNRIQYYTNLLEKHRQKVEEAKKANDESKESTERLEKAYAQLANTQEALTTAKDRLVTIDKQILDLSPNLIKSLVDENGRLTDNTGNFEANTRAIKDNIEARRRMIDEQYQYQLISARVEKEEAQREIDRYNEIIKKGKELRDSNVIDQNLYKVGGWIISRFAGDEYKEKYNNVVQMMGAKNEDDYNYVLNKLRQTIMEQQQKIESADKILNEPEQLIAMGFYRKDENGNPIYDENGNLIADKAAYEKQQLMKSKYLSDTFEENPTQYIEDILGKVDDEVEKIKLPYEIKMNQRLLETGKDTEDEEYLKNQSEMNQKVAAYYRDLANDLRTLKSRNDQEINSLKESAQDANTELGELLKEGLSMEEIFREVYRIREHGWEVMSNELSKYKKQFEVLVGANDDYLEILEQEFSKIDNRLYVAETLETKIQELELKRAEALTNFKKQSKSEYEKFEDELKDGKKILELRKDLSLQQKQLQGYSEESSMYKATLRHENLTMREYLLQMMDELNRKLASGLITDAEERYDAQIQLLELQKEANSLLLEIKENTAQIGEFNKPGFVKAITMYDYRAKDQTSTTFSIGDAKFVMQVTAPQTLEDVDSIMKLFKDYFTPYIKRNDAAGYKTADLLR